MRSFHAHRCRDSGPAETIPVQLGAKKMHCLSACPWYRFQISSTKKKAHRNTCGWQTNDIFLSDHSSTVLSKRYHVFQTEWDDPMLAEGKLVWAVSQWQVAGDRSVVFHGVWPGHYDLIHVMSKFNNIWIRLFNEFWGTLAWMHMNANIWLRSGFYGNNSPI